MSLAFSGRMNSLGARAVKQSALPFTHAPMGLTSRKQAQAQQRRSVQVQAINVQADDIQATKVQAPEATNGSEEKKKNYTCALLFDCDGVIVLTEELHRQAYNSAFKEFECTIDGKPLEWTVEYYDVLQNTVGGGKPKMKFHFKNNGWPASKVGPESDDEDVRNKLVDDLQDCKTFHYKNIVDTMAEARPGVLELMDEGLANDDVAMGICSAATKEGFLKVVNSIVGPERLAKFDIILAGDDVTEKKPSPLIYNIARERLGLPADKCVVIEDSLVGLKAALGANMRCIITPAGTSTDNVDFCAEGADAVIPTLKGDLYQVQISDIFGENCDDEDECVFEPLINLTGVLAEQDQCFVSWASASPFGSTLGV